MNYRKIIIFGISLLFILQPVLGIARYLDDTEEFNWDRDYRFTDTELLNYTVDITPLENRNISRISGSVKNHLTSGYHLVESDSVFSSFVVSENDTERFDISYDENYTFDEMYNLSVEYELYDGDVIEFIKRGIETDNISVSPHKSAYRVGDDITLSVTSGEENFKYWSVNGSHVSDSLTYTWTVQGGETTIVGSFTGEYISEDGITSTISYTNIYTIEDLDDIRNDLGSNYRLMNDLDFNDSSSYDDSSNMTNYIDFPGWTPIGYGIGEDSFYGIFDGQNYTISNLYIENPFLENVGLFGYVDDASSVVRSLILENPDIVGDSRVGGIIGTGRYGSYYHLEVLNGSVEGLYQYIGGIIGHMIGGYFQYGYSNSDVIGGNYLGGILGYVRVDAEVWDITFNGTVDGSDRVGGCIGMIDSSTARFLETIGSVSGVDNVGGGVGYSSGSIIGEYFGTVESTVNGSENVGGVIGVSNFGTYIYWSTNYGTVDGTNYVGGLVGDNYESFILNSYSFGNVTGTSYVGGLVGYHWRPLLGDGYIENSYSTGVVSGSSDVGGLIGDRLRSTVSDSYWNNETSGITTSDGGTGKNTSEMTDWENDYPDCYSGWNFTSYWQTVGWNYDLDDNYGYPALYWETPISPSANFEWDLDNPTWDDDIQFTDLTQDGSGTISNWTWDFGDRNYNYTQNPLYSYDAGGEYTITLNVTDEFNSSDEISKNIFIYEPGAPISDFSWSPSNPLVNETITFTDESIPGDNAIDNWTWDFGDGNYSYLQNTTHSYPSVDTYTVTLTVTDTINLSDSKSYNVTTREPYGPTADFSWSPTDIPRYETITFTDESTPGDNAIDNWTWDFDDGNYSYIQNPTHSYSNAGTYSVTLTVTDTAALFDSKSYNVVVREPYGPSADFSWSPSWIDEGTTITFTDESTSGDYSIDNWTWDFDDGNYSYIQNPTHSYSHAGTYSVTLIVTDTVDLFDSVSYDLTVNPELIASEHHIFTIEDLHDVSVNTGDTFYLRNDLDFENSNDYDAPSTSPSLSEMTTGVGWPRFTFTGKFEGNNFTISNLYTNRPTENAIAFFSTLQGYCGNLTLSDVDITGQNAVGSLAGRIDTDGTIYNSGVIGGTVDGAEQLGGLIGSGGGALPQSFEVRSSFVIDVTVTSTGSYVGGFISQVVRDGQSIEDSYVLDSSISGLHYVGGFIGRAIYSNVLENCSVYGSTVSGSSQTGGFIGQLGDTSIVTLSRVVYTSVSGTTQVGGFIGRAQTTEISTDNYVDYGTITGTGQYVGGFVGYMSNVGVRTSFARANTTGDDYVGGFIGTLGSIIEMVNSTRDNYAFGNVTSNGMAGGFVGSDFYTLDSYYHRNWAAVGLSGTDLYGWGWKSSSISTAPRVYDSYWNTDIYPTNDGLTTLCPIGLTTDEMTDYENEYPEFSNYYWTNWLNDTSWNTDNIDNSGYPVLDWQSEPNGPTADFEWTPSLIHITDNISFTDLSTSGTYEIDNWTWDFDDGTISYDQNPTHSYSLHGNYTVTLTVTDIYSLSDSESKFVNVTSPEGPSANFSWLPDDPYRNEEIEFTDSSTSGDHPIDNWTWDFDDGTISYSQHPSHIYSSPGNYNVTLNVTDTYGLYSLKTYEITVTDIIEEVSLSYSLDFTIEIRNITGDLIYQNHTTGIIGSNITYIYDDLSYVWYLDILNSSLDLDFDYVDVYRSGLGVYISDTLSYDNRTFENNLGNETHTFMNSYQGLDNISTSFDVYNISSEIYIYNENFTEYPLGDELYLDIEEWTTFDISGAPLRQITDARSYEGDRSVIIQAGIPGKYYAHPTDLPVTAELDDIHQSTYMSWSLYTRTETGPQLGEVWMYNTDADKIFGIAHRYDSLQVYNDTGWNVLSSYSVNDEWMNYELEWNSTHYELTTHNETFNIQDPYDSNSYGTDGRYSFIIGTDRGWAYFDAIKRGHETDDVECDVTLSLYGYNTTVGNYVFLSSTTSYNHTEGSNSTLFISDIFTTYYPEYSSYNVTISSFPDADITYSINASHYEFGTHNISFTFMLLTPDGEVVYTDTCTSLAPGEVWEWYWDADAYFIEKVQEYNELYSVIVIEDVSIADEDSWLGVGIEIEYTIKIPNPAWFVGWGLANYNLIYLVLGFAFAMIAGTYTRSVLVSFFSFLSIIGLGVSFGHVNLYFFVLPLLGWIAVMGTRHYIHQAGDENE